jgi:hypothetical protein
MTEAQFEPSHVNVRIKISALWTSMLFVFAYVDVFSLYRPDVRADLEAGEIGGFTVDHALLFGPRSTSSSPAWWCSAHSSCDHGSTASPTSR